MELNIINNNKGIGKEYDENGELIFEGEYSIEIKKTDIESYNDDVRVYEIWKDNKLISYYFIDLFYRKGKRA